jgi:hypothetical protein
MPRPLPSRMSFVAVAVCFAASGGGCRGGCSPVETTARPAGGALVWFPPETQIVVAFDFARLRTTPLWSRLASLATSTPEDRARIDEMARRTGFDPLRQIDALIVGFPEEARTSGAMGLVLRGSGFDEARLIAYVRDQVGKQGDDLFSFKRAGRTMWATRREPTTAGFFPDDRTFVLGAGGWAEKMAELGRAAGPSAGAETNLPLAHLIERAGARNPIWAAAIVPAATRAALASDPALTSGAGISRLALGIDLGSGLEAKLVADLASHQQAEAMRAEVDAAVRSAKQSPQVLLLGIGPYLDGVVARAVDASAEVTVRLSASQVSDSLDRLGAFLSIARKAAVPGFPHP